MSREIKVCNVNTLNDVNDRVRTLQHTVTNEIATPAAPAEKLIIILRTVLSIR